VYAWHGVQVPAKVIENPKSITSSEITEEKNILLIYDEVVTGFRLAGMGGAAKYYGIAPDLACYGKVIGGGFPIGAFGGRRDIMEKVCNPTSDPEYKIFQSGREE
jgi:glutamate-1-semialdehyde 2,1-aminomutase